MSLLLRAAGQERSAGAKRRGVSPPAQGKKSACWLQSTARLTALRKETETKPNPGAFPGFFMSIPVCGVCKITVRQSFCK
ncbi:hypothetical protein CEF21_10635 [Bacillus sp. FJAT-42376]|nr:hypothetical protein CEF21_10635 [Bacillus sp. FJAT-42376]